MMNEAAMAVSSDGFFQGGKVSRLWFSLRLQHKLINDPHASRELLRSIDYTSI